MKPLLIRWQRLVSDGETCQRCGSTERNLGEAVDQLRAALQPLGIAPVLETEALDDAAFRAQPSESNRIWIAGRPLEAWLGASVGASPCCSVCGDLPCRTVEVDGARYEAVPTELIVRAGMVAAASLIGPVARTTPAAGCCTDGKGCDCS